MSRPKLVIGASGFLGSHVTKQLVADGVTVRVLLRTTSSTRAIDGLRLNVTIVTLRQGRAACCDVGLRRRHYCAVDARPWLRDPSPMWRTNVDGLKVVLDVAVDADLSRFVFTSSIGTIGRSETGLADEGTRHNWLDVGGDYIRTRVAAEELVLRYWQRRRASWRRDVRVHHLRAGGLAADPARRASRSRGARKTSLLHRRLRGGSRGRRGCRAERSC